MILDSYAAFDSLDSNHAVWIPGVRILGWDITRGRSARLRFSFVLFLLILAIITGSTRTSASTSARPSEGETPRPSPRLPLVFCLTMKECYGDVMLRYVLGWVRNIHAPTAQMSVQWRRAARSFAAQRGAYRSSLDCEIQGGAWPVQGTPPSSMCAARVFTSCLFSSVYCSSSLFCVSFFH